MAPEPAPRGTESRPADASRKNTAFLCLLEEASVAIRESSSIQQAMRATLDLVCHHTGWPIAYVYALSPESPDELVPTSIWHVEDQERFATFRRLAHAGRFPPGTSLLGRVLASRARFTSVDVSKELTVLSGLEAEEVGLKGGFGFPVLAGGKVEAVLEFFSPETVAPNDEFLDVMEQICRQLGRVHERNRAEDALPRSEERWQAVFENSSIGVALADLGGRFAAANSAYQRLLGHTEEELRKLSYADIIHEDDREANRARVTELLDGRRQQFQIEERHWRKDGSLIWVNVNVSLVPGTESMPRFMMVLVEDITERKRLEQELKHERDRLRLLLDLNNSFASNLDLRQLFRAISAGLRYVMRSDAAVLSLLELKTDEIRVYAADFPEGKGFLKEGSVHPIEGSVGGRVFRTAKPLVFNDVPAWLSPEIQDLLAKEGLQSGCALPLIRRGRVLGILSLASLRENAFTQEDVNFLGQVADQVAIAAENALRYHQVTESRERLAEERLYLEDEIRRERDFGEIVGKSPALKPVLKQVKTVAATDSTVLILGETGTGKELIARAIHDLSSRRDRTFVRADCASIPAGLLESELFGHEKGAFTGAIAREIGRVELANKGTLFLDEVSDIPLELQSKLLRVLQEQEFERLGSTRTIRVDFRLVAATNRDLTRMVENGRFRSDLYYRLNVFPIEIPPLRKRPEDIPLLVWHFAKKYARRMNKRIEKIRAEDLEALAHYHWPGNVRELQNFVERSVILSPDAVLHPPLAKLKSVVRNAPPKARTLAESERECILQALEDADWVIGGLDGAAVRLGLKRTTLLHKMRRLGISRPEN